MNVREFVFDLPLELIAQDPPAVRGTSRLLHLDRRTGLRSHSAIDRIAEFLDPGDVVVVNNTRVFPARLLGRREPSGGAVECLLVSRISPDDAAPDTANLVASGFSRTSLLSEEVWQALMHPGQKLAPGARVVFEGSAGVIRGEVLERHFHGRRTIRLWTDDGKSIQEVVDAIGHVPLPPYIKRDDRADDRERYQTVFAQQRGSIAAPTAGLHFTPGILDSLKARDIRIAEITLHVGYGTFQPVRVERVEDHRLEAEHYDIPAPAAEAIETARAERRRVVAVGTTTTRTLEAAALSAGGRVTPGAGVTDLFIYPGFQFQVVTGLLTNFHLPASSLIMLVAAFGGKDAVMDAYSDAITRGYRFYSYGDAMLIT
jgi:S-adenosylmethionine:tRNA ribosyltransferase-isomerase